MLGNDSNEVTIKPSSPSPVQVASNSDKALNYNEQLKRDFGKIFDLLSLNSLQKEFLKSRWLDQVLWMEKKSARCRNRYTWFRMTTIVGGVIAPILFTFSIENPQANVWGKVATFSSAVVAVSSAVEGFFGYGRQWYSYRQSVESLKSQGWLFFQLTGPYLGRTHQEAFSIFSAQVEELIQRDVELYVTQISQQQQKLQEQEQKLLQEIQQQQQAKAEQ